MEERNFDRAVYLRGRSFQRNLDTYRLFAKLQAPKEKDNLSAGHIYNVAVMNVGAPAGGFHFYLILHMLSSLGMNAAVRSFVRMALYHRCRVFGVHNCFEGFANGQLNVRSFFH